MTQGDVITREKNNNKKQQNHPGQITATHVTDMETHTIPSLARIGTHSHKDNVLISYLDAVNEGGGYQQEAKR